MTIPAREIPQFERGMRLRHTKSKRLLIVVEVAKDGVTVFTPISRHKRQRFLTNKTLRSDYDYVDSLETRPNTLPEAGAAQPGRAQP